jgi:hypothetical protein
VSEQVRIGIGKNEATQDEESVHAHIGARDAEKAGKTARGRDGEVVDRHQQGSDAPNSRKRFDLFAHLFTLYTEGPLGKLRAGTGGARCADGPRMAIVSD